MNDLKRVDGKMDGSTVRWLDEPELCHKLMPGDVFLFNGEYATMSGHYGNRKPQVVWLRAEQLGPEYADLFGDYDSIQADQAALLGRP